MSASTGGPTMTCHDCREGTASGRVIYNEAHGAVLVCARCVDARAMFGQQTKRDKVEHGKVVLTGAKFRCTKCGKIEERLI